VYYLASVLWPPHETFITEAEMAGVMAAIDGLDAGEHDRASPDLEKDKASARVEITEV
jgi:hypothetical protein